MRGIIDWIESRTGLETAFQHFLDEDIPASAGWHQVLGSVALFCFMAQIFTGVMLSLNYAASPGDAHNSIRYLMNEVTAGKLIRGLHHWGASMMIVVVVLHMLQVFLWGAYKKPREATWLVGIGLLMLTLAFGLTGYLLPWDNRAYWGTVVTTQIAAKAPFAGPYLERLMGSENGVGAVTFARFYAMHVMLLPLITTLVIGLHVFLVRRHGVAPSPGDDAPKKKFFPEQVFKDTVAMFAAFAVLFTLAATMEAPLGRLADPTDTTYIPRPEWYFLFLFQTLKFFEGPLEVVGAHILPGLAVALLAAMPFLDRARIARLRQRTMFFGVAGLALAGWAALTLAAVRSTPKEALTQDLPEAPVEAWQALSAEELAGIGYYRREACGSCHLVGGQGTANGPDLTTGAHERDAKWMLDHFKRPAEIVPGSEMPPTQLSDSQLNAVAAFLLRLRPGNATALISAPATEVEGAIIYQRFQCSACHQINGVGKKLGPNLNGLRRRREKEWIVQHFAEPQKLSPGTTMPPYRFPPRDLERILAYLQSVPDRPVEDLGIE
ncbi:MAG: cytochrome b N-terminal domain-containing protein [Bryobacteraceae bacterium]